MSTGQALAGSYDWRLVFVSILMAVLASYTALDLAARVTATRGRAQVLWLTGGAIAMGIGIWAMHFSGMLAFRLPIPVAYHWPTTLLSLAIAAGSSLLALLVASRTYLGWRRAAVGGVFMAGGIVGLHYVAMASMRLQAMCRYWPPLVALSGILAFAFSFIALRLTFRFRDDTPGERWRKIAGAVLMGAAVSAMHYTGMAAAMFIPSDARLDLSRAVSVSTLGIAGISIVSAMVLILTLVTSMVDRLQRQKGLLEQALEQSRALAARVQHVREDERARVAREIHDELGQALTSIKIGLASVIRELPADGTWPAEKLQSIIALADETIRAVRRIATELRPGVLDDLGLVAAVEWAADEFQARTGIDCRLDLPKADIAMSPDAATSLFRIVQETLTNVARHAGASAVNIALATGNGVLTLDVRDNGIGLDEALPAGRSLGIIGMRERARLIGGELTLVGVRGQGTTVSVRIPEAQLRD